MANVTPRFTGQVKGFAIAWDRPIDRARWVHSLHGQRIEETIRKQRTQRSERQNRAYFGLCVAILAEHCGYDQDEMHEALAWKFLSRDESGDPLPRRRSTASLTTAEFEDYVSRIRRWAAEMGCDIPEPNEVDA